MTFALTEESMQECCMGSEEYILLPDEVTLLIEGMPAVSINGTFQMPFHGECKIWTAVTLGVVDECIAMISEPVLLPGSLITKGPAGPLGLDENIYICSYGVITTLEGAVIFETE